MLRAIAKHLATPSGEGESDGGRMERTKFVLSEEASWVGG